MVQQRSHPSPAPAPVSRRRLPAYFNRMFGMVWAGNTLSAFGDGFATVALGLWVLQSTGSAVAMSQVLLVRSILGALFGAIGGAVADRFNRQALLVVCDLARAGIFAAIAWLMATSPEVPLYTIMALLGLSTIFTTLFDPALAASVVMMVGKEHLTAANGLNSFTNMGARVFGPILGGVVVKLYGGEAGMAINAASFIVSGLFILGAGRIPSPAPPTTGAPAGAPPAAGAGAGAGAGRPPFFALLAEGFRFLRADPLIGPLVFWVIPAVMFFATGLSLLLPVISVEVWKADGPLYGAVQGLFAAGFSVGFLILMLFGRKMRSRGRLFGFLMAAAGLLLAVAGNLPTAYLALPVLFLIGLVFAVSNVVPQVAIQGGVPPEVQGRVFGVSQALVNLAGPLALLLAGLLSDRFGAANVMLGAGAGVALVGAVAMAFPAIRRFD